MLDLTVSATGIATLPTLTGFSTLATLNLDLSGNGIVDEAMTTLITAIGDATTPATIDITLVVASDDTNVVADYDAFNTAFGASDAAVTSLTVNVYDDDSTCVLDK